MEHQDDLNNPQSPAGRAPTLLTRVAARPAGDVPNPQKCRNIAPTLEPKARKLFFYRTTVIQHFFYQTELLFVRPWHV